MAAIVFTTTAFVKVTLRSALASGHVGALLDATTRHGPGFEALVMMLGGLVASEDSSLV
jgi:hypothetical protein